MIDLPDAPWIREAELYGMPDAPDVYCPICGAENPDDFFTDQTGSEVIGCSECMRRYDPWQWVEDHRPDE